MKISVSILCWNGLANTIKLIESLLVEVSKSKHKFTINVADNGSTDGTKEFLQNQSNIKSILLDRNYGISIAKNLLIDKAISDNSKYMFMFDNDVLIVPDSLDVMIDWMESNQSVSCLGQNINFYTKDIEDARLNKKFEITEVKMNVKSGCGAIRSWTHYSIYRTSVFDEVRFDTEGPFSKAGYGFDDDDLGMQISKFGYYIACFENVYIYHNINSSVPMLESTTGLNYSEREKYFKKKWNLA